MWSGNAQLSGGSYPTQWALNPAAYVNMPNEQVDWASLAQQWIKMKESQPETSVGAETAVDSMNIQAPPPPVISAPAAPPVQTQQPFYPMHQEEMPASGGTWGWSWDGGGSSGWSGAGWDQSSSTTDSTVYQDGMGVQSTHTITPSIPVAPTYSPAYHEGWGSSVGGTSSSGRKEWRKHRQQTHHHHSPQPPPPPQPQIDAVKRKQLPAWIREGLEKMEREKLKKQQEEEQWLGLVSTAVMNGSPSGLPDDSDVHGSLSSLPSPTAPISSKFDEDDVLEDVADARRRSSERSPVPVASRAASLQSPPILIPKSKDEIFQSVMAGVGRILTQLLMEVTNEEVMQTVTQVLQRHKIKGLGIYDSEDSGSDSGVDSEHQIKARIKKRQEEFSKRENEIEKEIEEQEEREKRVLFGKSQDGAEASSTSVDSVDEDKVGVTPSHPEPRQKTTTPPPVVVPTPSHSNHRHRSTSASRVREKEYSDSREQRRSSRHSKSRRRRRSSDSSSSGRRRRSRTRSRDRRSRRRSSTHRHKRRRSRSLSTSTSSSNSPRYRHRRRHSHRSSRR